MESFGGGGLKGWSNKAFEAATLHGIVVKCSLLSLSHSVCVHITTRFTNYCNKILIFIKHNAGHPSTDPNKKPNM